MANMCILLKILNNILYVINTVTYIIQTSLWMCTVIRLLWTLFLRSIAELVQLVRLNNSNTRLCTHCRRRAALQRDTTIYNEITVLWLHLSCCDNASIGSLPRYWCKPWLVRRWTAMRHCHCCLSQQCKVNLNDTGLFEEIWL